MLSNVGQLGLIEDFKRAARAPEALIAMQVSAGAETFAEAPRI